jgi:hypothetical protein
MKNQVPEGSCGGREYNRELEQSSSTADPGKGLPPMASMADGADPST